MRAERAAASNQSQVLMIDCGSEIRGFLPLADPGPGPEPRPAHERDGIAALCWTVPC
ncbi:hypothetical protein [Microvirga pudoricolor]|uniref:hypothetical protein n=1 Tax=Microvirga pudoricolor TaxID=2778729 RepID=UPI0019524110|nr:hypothetical protein [Microvirga pudoricolor]MBM6595009.1 hypothetical protein [Microvirga pudoricolor]